MSDKKSETPRKHGLGDVFSALGRPKVAVMLGLGFSSGLPFLLTGNTLGFPCLQLFIDEGCGAPGLQTE